MNARVDAAALVEFFDVPTSDLFNVPPEQAVAFFKAKGLTPTFSFADMLGESHAHSFTVAKMMNVDMLGQVRASLDSALANGTPFKEWADGLIPVLQAGGWWGRKEVVDPLTGGTIVAQLGSPARLETIFRTNMQSAYAAGQWQEIQSQAEVAPFLMYDAVDDLRTRPLHAAWDRTVLPVTSPWWRSHYPPNGWNCRCGVIQLTADELAGLNMKPAAEPPEGGTYLWQNPRTGQVLKVPNGLDPGFDHNPGVTYLKDLEKLLAEKTANLPSSLQLAAESAAAQKAAAETLAAAKAAQAEVAQAAAKAALVRAQAAAEKKAAEFAAKAQIDAIKAGKDTAGKGAGYKIKALAQLAKSPGWDALPSTQQITQVLALADEFKFKTETASKLSVYKKAVLDGKTPPPATVKAFQTLTPEDQAAFLAKLDAEKAAAEAKKAAEAAAASKKAAGAVPSAQVQAPEPTPPDPATMVVIGRKTKGGTEGAIYQDTATGTKWVVKFNGSEDAVRNEVLAARLYNAAGVEAPELHSIVIGGRPALASRIIDGIVEVDAKTLAGTKSALDGFAVDAWLANWDVVGLSFDNIVLVGGRAVRIDVGGSLRYRALGTQKGAAFGRTVGEIDSLRDGTNSQARAVFGKITQAELEAGAEKVLAVSEADIRALVARFGPVDQAERAALADLLIERQRDIARRFPAAADRVRARAAGAKAQATPAARVTAQEQERVEASRVNGYAFPTDSDQIEDNSVLVHAFRRKDGAEATRGFMKLLPGASAELEKRVAATGGEANLVRLDEARASILAAVKSINLRVEQGKAMDPRVLERITEATKQIDMASLQLAKARAIASKLDKLDEAEAYLTEWRKALQAVVPAAKDGKPWQKMPQFFSDRLPTELKYTPKAKAAAAAGLQWKRVSGAYSFDTADFDRSFAKENGGKANVAGASLRYEAELPDGTRIVYFPHDSSVAYAMQGVVKIDVPGKGTDATGRVFGALDQMGIKSTRATETDRQHLYLNAFARIRLLRANTARFKAEFDAITDKGEAGVQAKLAVLKRATGVDVAASEGWKSVDGVRQAFGHGRAYQLRPDLTVNDMAEMGRGHVVFHNPKGLGWDAGTGAFERLKTVIEGGGMFASLTDRVRRGVALAGSSVSSDLASGGGDYHFTRIGARSVAKGAGVYWRTNVLRRMDAITYAGDNFGRTTPGHIESNRLGQDRASLEKTAYGSGGSSSNETIFKGGLSIFDDVERIVLSSEAEVKAAIAWMQSKGYKTWPDGRALGDVIISKAKHSAKP
jgi:SPP1 gp7 family putative phage head morphogenesis protein